MDVNGQRLQSTDGWMNRQTQTVPKHFMSLFLDQQMWMAINAVFSEHFRTSTI